MARYDQALSLLILFFWLFDCIERSASFRSLLCCIFELYVVDHTSFRSYGAAFDANLLVFVQLSITESTALFFFNQLQL